MRRITQLLDIKTPPKTIYEILSTDEVIDEVYMIPDLAKSIDDIADVTNCLHGVTKKNKVGSGSYGSVYVVDVPKLGSNYVAKFTKYRPESLMLDRTRAWLEAANMIELERRARENKIAKIGPKLYAAWECHTPDSGSTYLVLILDKLTDRVSRLLKNDKYKDSFIKWFSKLPKYLEVLGFSHGDLSGGNVMFSETDKDMRFYIIDFASAIIYSDYNSKPYERSVFYYESRDKMLEINIFVAYRHTLNVLEDYVFYAYWMLVEKKVLIAPNTDIDKFLPGGQYYEIYVLHTRPNDPMIRNLWIDYYSGTVPDIYEATTELQYLNELRTLVKHMPIFLRHIDSTLRHRHDQDENIDPVLLYPTNEIVKVILPPISVRSATDFNYDSWMNRAISMPRRQRLSSEILDGIMNIRILHGFYSLAIFASYIDDIQVEDLSELTIVYKYSRRNTVDSVYTDKTMRYFEKLKDVIDVPSPQLFARYLIQEHFYHSNESTLSLGSVKVALDILMIIVYYAVDEPLNSVNLARVSYILVRRLLWSNSTNDKIVSEIRTYERNNGTHWFLVGMAEHTIRYMLTSQNFINTSIYKREKDQIDKLVQHLR